MKKITQFINRWACTTDAATAIEYCLIAAGIALTIVAVVFSIGGTVRDDMFSALSDSFNQ